MFQLTPSPIDREILIKELSNQMAGALVAFEGWVRDHNQGKKVSSLEYQVYEALAEKEGQKILREATEKFNLHDVRCVHRFGHLALGDTAVWIGAVASHRDDAFRATRYVIDEIKLRLPVWKKEHYVHEEARWVFCRDHHTHVHFDEGDYYRKQSALVDQERLKVSHVLVVGAGGLGCPVLTSLATAGVGHIDIADPDTISLSNIHRQPLYSPEVVGEKKVTVATGILSRLNPFIHVNGHELYVSAENVEGLLSGKDLVIDCTDNLETKYLLHDACFRKRLPLVSASVYQFEGQIRTFLPGMNFGCLRCSGQTAPEDSILGNCNDYGVLGSAVSVVGSIQASEAIQFLLTGKNNTAEATFFIDLKTLSQMKIKNLVQSDCLSCTGEREIFSSILEVSGESLSDAILLDVREKEDHILEDYITADKPVIVYCHKGVRSKRLVQQMHERGHKHFLSLRGGACSL